jgi:hypothetical protein
MSTSAIMRDMMASALARTALRACTSRDAAPPRLPLPPLSAAFLALPPRRGSAAVRAASSCIAALTAGSPRRRRTMSAAAGGGGPATCSSW